MKRLAPTLVSILLLCGVAAPPPVHAQTPETPPEAASIASRLASIDDSLRQLVALLEQQVRNQRAQLAVQRLDLARRDVVARETELHEARMSRDEYADELEAFTVRLEILEADEATSGPEEVDLERMRRQAGIQLEGMKQRIWRLDQRVLDLEAEIRRAREDLTIWEEIVAEDL